jgi:Flp pilus assembly protein TadD
VSRLVVDLAERADAAHAADQLIRLLKPGALVVMCQGLAAIHGAAFAPVLDELAARDELEAVTRRRLLDLRARLGGYPELPGRRGEILVAEQEGRSIIVAVARGSRARPRRVLVIELGADGCLRRAEYDATGAATFGPKALRGRFAAEGLSLRRRRLMEVSARIAIGARRARAKGDSLPSAYYLGRDLVGLVDEHMTPPAPASAPHLLERGRGELERGNAAAARPLLAAYVSVEPQDGEARTWLAGALLALGDREAALAHLTSAARLEPEDPLRHFNVAAAARQVGRAGAAYLALGQFLLRSRSGRAPARRRAALRFRRKYEQMIAREHPGARARDVARHEDVFACACEHLEHGRFLDAVRGFEQVLGSVPSHYPSWSNLGAAYLRLDRPDDARRCLEQALEVRPDYEMARSNLRALDGASP